MTQRHRPARVQPQTLSRSRASAPPIPRSRLIDPDDVTHAAKPAFIVLTLVVVWLLSLLPWRAHPWAPDLLCLALAFWAMHEPHRVGLAAAFGFGLLIDVHDASLLGNHALLYTLIAYGALKLHRRLRHFGLWAQTLHMAPVFVAVHLLTTLLAAWSAGRWPGWDWLAATTLTAALWAPVGAILQLPQRPPDAGEAQ